MKKCSKCKENKNFINFHKHKRTKDGYASRCKECSLVDKKNYYEKNKDKVKKMVKEYRENNLDDVKNHVKSYYYRNRESLLEYKKNYHKENKEYFNELNLKYREKNKKSINESKRKYISNKRKTDNLFKLKENISKLINHSLKSKGFKKKYKSEEILHCTIQEFKKYIESKFLEGMSWENHGDWHLDHKIPVSWGKNEIEIYELNHYTNFQPLWKKDNLSKGNRWESL
jgi:hypothetical protein